MRQIIFAPSFGREAEDIGVYIEESFGDAARWKFLKHLSDTCVRIAEIPGLGVTDHGYEIGSAGFVFDQNWIFFEYDDDNIHFLHIVDTQRHKPNVSLN